MNGRRDSLREALTVTLLNEVREVYRDLSALPIERSCMLRTECCRFKLTGLTPYLTRGEALVAALALRGTGSTTVVTREDGACPMLDDEDRCRIYEARPLGCRTHFCSAAGGPYPRRQVVDLIRRLEAVDQQLGGDGPQALPVALQSAMRIAAGRSGKRSNTRRL